MNLRQLFSIRQTPQSQAIPGTNQVLNEAGAKRIVVTCAHCYNTLANEYPQVGGHYEVVHHTTLLARLVADKRLTPVQRVDAAVTYHDPCYLGRHNGVYTPPRELLGALPGVTMTEMPRHGEKSFCCGAGGARMWVEEKLGTRINLNRTSEAVAPGAARIAVGCPFCKVMLSDGVNKFVESEVSPLAGGTAQIEVVDGQLPLRIAPDPDPQQRGARRRRDDQ